MNHQQYLMEAMQDASGDIMNKYARDEVLFNSFEKGEVEFHVADEIEYDERLVMPSKFTDKMWHYVHQTQMGHRVKVGSNYYGRARVVDQDRVNPKPFGSGETTQVLVLYRCTAQVDKFGSVRDAEVIVSRRPGNWEDV